MITWVVLNGSGEVVDSGACTFVRGGEAPVVRELPKVETDWTQGFGRSIRNQNVFNEEIASALRNFVFLPPEILKSILAQESGFAPQARNEYGYAGIAQLGLAEARFVGLKTGSSRMGSTKQGIKARFDLEKDQRFVPRLAIPGAALLLNAKASALEHGVVTKSGQQLIGFSTLGRPSGDDYWKFVSAAYNGGEGTILKALQFAYGGVAPDEVRWADMVKSPNGNIRRTPLWRAIAAVGMDPRVKFREISQYADNVLRRARQ